MTQTYVSNTQLLAWLDSNLQPEIFRDYAPNGLQVQGQSHIHTLITGVTASLELIEAAIEHKAQAILVHHGWFWKGENPCITGIKHARLTRLLAHDINLFAYHLPLDAHPVLGNNAQLASIFNFIPNTLANGQPQTVGEQGLVWLGQCQPQPLKQLEQHLAQILGRSPLVIGKADQEITRVAWCSGGAQNFMQDAIDAGAQVFITGEASEQNYHLARESGVAFIAAGHHATETYGVQALGREIARNFDINVRFINFQNPI